MMMASRRYLSRLAQSRVLSVTPSSSMIDQQVAIKATGMEANSLVTIRYGLCSSFVIVLYLGYLFYISKFIKALDTFGNCQRTLTWCRRTPT